MDLISSEVGNNQLCLIIQHLLKVRHMPVFIGGVTVKTLNNDSKKEIFCTARVLMLNSGNDLIISSLVMTMKRHKSVGDCDCFWFILFAFYFLQSFDNTVRRVTGGVI